MHIDLRHVGGGAVYIYAGKARAAWNPPRPSCRRGGKGGASVAGGLGKMVGAQRYTYCPFHTSFCPSIHTSIHTCFSSRANGASNRRSMSCWPSAAATACCAVLCCCICPTPPASFPAQKAATQRSHQTTQRSRSQTRDIPRINTSHNPVSPSSSPPRHSLSSRHPPSPLTLFPVYARIARQSRCHSGSVEGARRPLGRCCCQQCGAAHEILQPGGEEGGDGHGALVPSPLAMWRCEQPTGGRNRRSKQGGDSDNHLWVMLQQAGQGGEERGGARTGGVGCGAVQCASSQPSTRLARQAQPHAPKLKLPSHSISPSPSTLPLSVPPKCPPFPPTLPPPVPTSGRTGPA